MSEVAVVVVGLSFWIRRKIDRYVQVSCEKVILNLVVPFLVVAIFFPFFFVSLVLVIFPKHFEYSNICMAVKLQNVSP
jgi:hypothetical protein